MIAVVACRPVKPAEAQDMGRGRPLSAIARLTGRQVAHTGLDYVGNHISLGRRDGILQPVDREARARTKFMGGRNAARVKAGILRTALWTTSHPTFGLPTRTHRVTTAPEPAGAATPAANPVPLPAAEQPKAVVPTGSETR